MVYYFCSILTQNKSFKLGYKIKYVGNKNRKEKNMKKKFGWGLALTTLGGMAIGALLEHTIYIKRNTFGKLKIDTSDSNKDCYSIEINDLSQLKNKKHVVLLIEKED